MSEYNGWTNWETWNFKLWLDNDYVTYKSVTSGIAICNDISEGSIYLKCVAETLAEDQLKDHEGSSVIHDFVNASISKINFDEIAESYLEEIEDEVS